MLTTPGQPPGHQAAVVAYKFLMAGGMDDVVSSRLGMVGGIEVDSRPKGMDYGASDPSQGFELLPAFGRTT